MREIVLTVSPDGNLKVVAEGYSGPACEKKLREIARMLGETTSSGRKPEFYQKNTQQQKAGQG